MERAREENVQLQTLLLNLTAHPAINYTQRREDIRHRLYSYRVKYRNCIAVRRKDLGVRFTVKSRTTGVVILEPGVNLVCDQLAQVLRVAAARELREEHSESVVTACGQLLGCVRDLVADEMAERSFACRFLLLDIEALIKLCNKMCQTEPENHTMA